MASTELRQVAEEFRRRRAIAGGAPPDLNARRMEFEASAPPPPADAKVVPTSADGVPADWVLAPGADPDQRLLYLHGGGYIIGSRVSHRRLAVDISRAAGCAVLNLDYRLAPEWPFPAALEDAVAAFKWMCSNGPSGPSRARSAFIAGDSAGGGLTLATTLALRDRDDVLPNATITLSAWTDLAATGESLRTRAAVDPVLAGGAEALSQTGAAYAGTSELAAPLVSPLYADFAGLPPLLMLVGDVEVLLDDTLRVVERARSQGVDVTLHLEPEGFHVYPMFAPDAPESKAALKQIGAFVRSHRSSANGH